jgi:hypothetical protein
MSTNVIKLANFSYITYIYLGLKQAKRTGTARSETSWLCYDVPLNFVTRHCVCVTLPVDKLLPPSTPTPVPLMIS